MICLNWGQCILRWLLQANDVRGYQAFFPQVVCKNGSHKLTACFKVYSTYNVRAKKIQEEPGCYMLLLLEVTMYFYHKWYAKTEAT